MTPLPEVSPSSVSAVKLTQRSVPQSMSARVQMEESSVLFYSKERSNQVVVVVEEKDEEGEEEEGKKKKKSSRYKDSTKF